MYNSYECVYVYLYHCIYMSCVIFIGLSTLCYLKICFWLTDWLTHAADCSSISQPDQPICASICWEMLNLLMIYIIKSPLQLIIGTHIVWYYTSDIAASCNEASQCKDKWICLHWGCDFNMHYSTCKTCDHCTISLQFLPALFYHKWTKNICSTVC